MLFGGSGLIESGLKKTERQTAPKSRGGSLAVGTYVQRGSAPPPFSPRGTWRGGGVVVYGEYVLTRAFGADFQHPYGLASEGCQKLRFNDLPLSHF